MRRLPQFALPFFVTAALLAQEPPASTPESVQATVEHYLAEGLDLVASTDASSSELGWAAVLSQLQWYPIKKIQKLTPELGRRIEKEAAKSLSPTANLAVAQLYANFPSVAITRFFEDKKTEASMGVSRQEADRLFFAAMFSETQRLLYGGLTAPDEVAKRAEQLDVAGDDKLALVRELYLPTKEKPSTDMVSLWSGWLTSVDSAETAEKEILIRVFASLILQQRPALLGPIVEAKGAKVKSDISDRIGRCSAQTTKRTMVHRLQSLCQTSLKSSVSSWDFDFQKLTEALAQGLDGNTDPTKATSYAKALKVSADVRFIAVRVRRHPEYPTTFYDAGTDPDKGSPLGRDNKDQPAAQKALIRKGPVICILGCLSEKAAAVEPTSLWHIFVIAPGYQGELKFEMAAEDGKRVPLELGAVRFDLKDQGFQRNLEQPRIDYASMAVGLPNSFVLPLEPGRFDQLEVGKLGLLDISANSNERRIYVTLLKSGWNDSLPERPAIPSNRGVRTNPRYLEVTKQWYTTRADYVQQFAVSEDITVSNAVLDYAASLHTAMSAKGLVPSQ